MYGRRPIQQVQILSTPPTGAISKGQILCTLCTCCVAKRLQLNADKTEIWFGSANLRKLSANELNIGVGQDVAKPVTIRPESWCSDRRRVIDARPRLATGADVLFSLTPSTLSASSSSARPRRHGTIGLCSRHRTVTTRLKLGLAIVPLCRGTGAPFDEHRRPLAPSNFFDVCVTEKNSIIAVAPCLRPWS